MPSREETCLSARVPNSLSCKSVINERRDFPLTPESQSVIARVPEYFETLKQTHGLDYANLSDYTIEAESTNTLYLIAEGLYNDYMAGSPVGSALLSLGHRIDQVPAAREHGKTVKVLRPSLNLSEIYQKLYSQLLPKTSDNAKIEDLIIPALLFSRINPESRKREIILSRPGLDPIPDTSQGWKLKDQALLDLPTFALNLSQGKIPLEYKMNHHDLAHSLDYISSPHLVKWFKAYHKALYERSLLYGLKPELKLAGEYLHEFLMFPKPEKRAEFFKLIQMQKTAQGKNAREKNRLGELRDQLDSGELSKRIEILRSKFFDLFEAHGGGMLDGISHHKFGDIPNSVINQAQRGYLSIPMPTVPAYVGRDSFWGLIQQMALMNEVLSPGKNKSAAAQFVARNLSDPQSMLPPLIVELMKKFEDKVEASLRFGMTAENLFEDLFSPNFKKTSSYLYFKQVSHPNSLEYHVFVKENYLPKP